jgi:hypothetical protein
MLYIVENEVVSWQGRNLKLCLTSFLLQPIQSNENRMPPRLALTDQNLAGLF